MAYIYLDDSKHHKYDFSLAAFVICENDPAIAIRAIFRNYGFEPSSFEFKSSAKMRDDHLRRALRDDLKSYIQRYCKIAVCITNQDKKLGCTALELLRIVLKHPSLVGQQNSVFFDEGLFRSERAIYEQTQSDNDFAECNFFFEQDSKEILGIQLADLAAHTCSIMLLDQLGHISKKVILRVPGDEIYDGVEVELGFEMWASIRYAFLSQNKKDCGDGMDIATVEVYPLGLLVDELVNQTVFDAAMIRFGEIYLGCIH